MEEEEKEGRDYVGHLVRIIILGWSLAVMTLGYMERIRLDTFAAGLVSGVLGSYGISVGNKKSGTNNSNGPKIIDNSKNKVGIK